MTIVATDASAKRHLLFVYGSLKRGEENHAYLSGQRYIGEARTGDHYRMYELDGYPGLVRVAENGTFVTGELWEIDAACLAKLDTFEGVHVGLYRRESVALTAPREGLHAEAYFYAQSVHGRKLLGPTWKRTGG